MSELLIAARESGHAGAADKPQLSGARYGLPGPRSARSLRRDSLTDGVGGLHALGRLGRRRPDVYVRRGGVWVKA